MKKIRVGVIGVGYLGKFHAQKYAAMDDVELAGVVDVDEAIAARVAATCNTTPYTDFRKLLDHVDAVSVVVPTSYHHTVASACLDRGIDLLIEKPMTSSLAEADDLISRAEANKCILQVGLLERFNPAVMAMRDHLTTPLFIESHRIHSFKSRGLDVDVVLDLMIHDIDIILSVVKSPLKTIHTVGVPVVTNTTDIANARLIFENGCTANVTVSRISKENIRRMRIFQPNAYLSVDFAKKEIMVIKQLPGFDENGMPKEDQQNFAYGDKDALETELRDFVANVRTRTTPQVSGHAGRRALEVVTQIMSQNRQHAEQFKSLLQG